MSVCLYVRITPAGPRFKVPRPRTARRETRIGAERDSPADGDGRRHPPAFSRKNGARPLSHTRGSNVRVERFGLRAMPKMACSPSGRRSSMPRPGDPSGQTRAPAKIMGVGGHGNRYGASPPARQTSRTNTAKRRPAALVLLFDLGPRVLHRDRAVEDSGASATRGRATSASDASAAPGPTRRRLDQLIQRVHRAALWAAGLV